MKSRLILAFACMLGVAGISAIGTVKSTIVGKINPPDAAESVWAISTTDSVKAGISTGQFALDVKPGTYKLVIDARDPYKDVLLENLQVAQDQTLDLGEIPLKQ